jgi:6-phosphofructokinase 2
MGAAGALSVSADGMWRSRAPEIKARGTVGAGDAMVAALVSALERRMTAPEALRFATAFGSAAAASANRGPSAENVEHLLSEVSIESLSPAAVLDGRETAR